MFLLWLVLHNFFVAPLPYSAFLIESVNSTIYLVNDSFVTPLKTRKTGCRDDLRRERVCSFQEFFSFISFVGKVC